MNMTLIEVMELLRDCKQIELDNINKAIEKLKSQGGN